MKKLNNYAALSLLVAALIGPGAMAADMAPAAPEKVQISLSRGGCYGSCPAYRVDIYADGTVLYEGYRDVKALGKERYTVAPDEVKKLLQSALSKKLMALEESYQGNITDAPTYVLTLELDGRTHKIVDYVGQLVGMPVAVSEFEQEIDHLLGEAVRRRLSPQGLAQLANEGYDFDTPAGLAVLRRAIDASSVGEDHDLLALYDRLASLRLQRAPAQELQENMAIRAIASGRATLLRQMLARGALRKGGKYNKEKIDHAFYMAVVSGHPALVEMLWQLPEQAPHPSLLYDDARWAPAKGSKRVPITLLLGSDLSRPKNGNDFAIAKFLVNKGCDPRAIGGKEQTLLHIATASDDVNFVRYVLGLGVKPSMPGPFRLPALTSARNEDVAMALLEAGMAPRLVNKLKGFRAYCEQNKWVRVLAWLETHPG